MVRNVPFSRLDIPRSRMTFTIYPSISSGLVLWDRGKSKDRVSISGISRMCQTDQMQEVLVILQPALYAHIDRQCSA